MCRTYLFTRENEKRNLSDKKYLNIMRYKKQKRWIIKKNPIFVDENLCQKNRKKYIKPKKLYQVLWFKAFFLSTRDKIGKTPQGKQMKNSPNLQLDSNDKKKSFEINLKSWIWKMFHDFWKVWTFQRKKRSFSWLMDETLFRNRNFDDTLQKKN